MSNRRVKSLAYEDDDFDDEPGGSFGDSYSDDGNNEMSEEDKINMREGTAQVKAALGISYSVPERDIQDALWNYYWDVAKSVTYLKTLHKPKTPAKPKVKPIALLPGSAKDFFSDCPWLNIPQHRLADITEIAPPRGRLLGGSSKDVKMSKLAALAARRRQKENNKSISPQETTFASSLDGLSITPKPSQPEPIQEKRQSDIKPVLKAEEIHSKEEPAVISRAAPSIFARTVTNTTPKQTPKSAAKSTPKPSFVTNGVASLSIAEPLKSKSKKIDVVSAYNSMIHKRSANFVVIGHVDAGKSTLMGRLLYDLKAIDERTMEKYRKEAANIGKSSFAFAWVMDEGSEERERGVTIDIAQSTFSTDTTDFTILDSPGHQDFVPNMIAGASQADFAVLVLDASGSNFEAGLRGQTKEHALLARSTGLQYIIVAINKMDMADWSEDRYNTISDQTTTFLLKAGFQSKNLAFVPCSGLHGDNILQRTSDQNASWYTGKTLVENLDAAEITSHSMNKPLRIPITDVFRGSIQNPLSISGRIECGTTQTGELIVIMPSGEQALIRSIEVDYEPVEWAVAGQNVILNLQDIDPAHLKTGDIVCHPDAVLQNVSKFRARLVAFEPFTPQLVDIHRGRLDASGRISELHALLDKGTGEVVKKKPRVVAAGSLARVTIEVNSPIPVEAGNRVILRANGHSIAAGWVE